MPTYEFRCPDGHTFDRFYRKMSDAVSEVPCPECGKPAVRRISGGSGLVFKGSGFYLTDYGKNAHRGGEPADGGKPSGEGAASGGDSKGGDAKPAESKAESKSESKTDTKASEAKAAQGKTAGGGSSGSSSDK
jgi:putative FmdB family regulatory protein